MRLTAQMDGAGSIKGGGPCQKCPVPGHCAAQFAAATGNLASDESLLSQPVRPVGRQGAVGRSGNRIFIDTSLRSENLDTKS